MDTPLTTVSDSKVTVIPKIRKDLRSAIEDVFESMGGSQGMVDWIAESTVNKRIFYKDILPKVIPKQLTGEFSGPGGAPMKMVVEWAGSPQPQESVQTAPAQAVIGIVTSLMEDPSMD